MKISRKSIILAAAMIIIVAGSVTAADIESFHVSEGPSQAVVTEARAVLLDQPLSTVDTNVYANQDFATANDIFDIFIADDFIIADTAWDIGTIFVDNNGWNGATDIGCASMLTWEIYNDGGGVPDGDPYGGGNAPVWSLAVAPTDGQVSITTGSGGIPSNVTLTLAVPANLTTGTYWLVFYPSADYTVCGQWGRQRSDTTNGAAAVVINPGGGFGYPTTWTSVQDGGTWGLATQDFAFRIEGVIVPVELQSFSIE